MTNPTARGSELLLRNVWDAFDLRALEKKLKIIFDALCATVVISELGCQRPFRFFEDYFGENKSEKYRAPQDQDTTRRTPRRDQAFD